LCSNLYKIETLVRWVDKLRLGRPAIFTCVFCVVGVVVLSVGTATSVDAEDGLGLSPEVELVKEITFEQDPDTWSNPSGVIFTWNGPERWGRDGIDGAKYRGAGSSDRLTASVTTEEAYNGSK